MTPVQDMTDHCNKVLPKGFKAQRSRDADAAHENAPLRGAWVLPGASGLSART